MNDESQLLAAGAAQYRARDFENARKSFLSAYVINAKTSTLLDLALAEYQTQRFTLCLRHFRQYLRAPDADPKKSEFLRAQILPRAESHAAQLSFNAPGDTEVSIDHQPDTFVGDGPFDVEPGKHHLELRRSGQMTTLDIEVALGEQQRVDVTFPVSIERDVRPVVVPASAALTRTPTPRTDAVVETDATTASTAKVVTTLTLAGASLASFGAALGFGLDSQHARTNADDLRARLSGSDSASACVVPATPERVAICRALGSELDRQSSSRSLTTGFLIAGGATALGALATWIFWPESPAKPSTAIRFAPSFDARGAGLRIGGVF